MMDIAKEQESADFSTDLKTQIVQLFNSKKNLLPLIIQQTEKKSLNEVLAKVLNEIKKEELLDSAIAWIFFSDDDVKIEKNKLEFSESIEKENLKLLEDVSQGSLGRNQILFFNWKKLENDNQKQIYESVMIKTQSEGIKTVVCFDESHEFITKELFNDIMQATNPVIITKISSKPFATEEDEKIFKKLISDGMSGGLIVCTE